MLRLAARAAFELCPKRFSTGTSRVACYHGHCMSPVERGRLHAFKRLARRNHRISQNEKAQGGTIKARRREFCPRPGISEKARYKRSASCHLASGPRPEFNQDNA